MIAAITPKDESILPRFLISLHIAMSDMSLDLKYISLVGVEDVYRRVRPGAIADDLPDVRSRGGLYNPAVVPFFIQSS